MTFLMNCMESQALRSHLTLTCSEDPENSWKTPGGWKISCFFETKPAGRELFQWGIKLKFSINLQHHISC